MAVGVAAASAPIRMCNVDELRARWQSLFPDARRDAALAGVDALIRAYTAPGRHYHNLAHIDDCLRELDAARDLAGDARAIELAIWFHDAVYDANRADNELRSAELAVSRLRAMGESPESVARVRRLILDTRHTTPPATPDGRLLCDIDLVGLAAAPGLFDANTALIRREYAHVADADFRRGRADFLREMLGRTRIYHTDRFHDRCNAAARANLARAVAAMA